VALGVFLWMLKYRPGADEDVYLPSGAGTGGRFAQSSEEPNEAGEQSEEPGSEESSEEPEADLPDADLPDTEPPGDPEGGA
jgi:hypothetical protein